MRITLPTANHSGLYILEGRLTGLWAKELLRVARAADQGYGHTFDLQEVFYVDCEGEEALRFLAGRGARFITESAYGKDLCNRLKLHRVGPSEADSFSGKSLEGCRKRRHRHIANTGSVDECATTDANQHSSSCAQ